MGLAPRGVAVGRAAICMSGSPGLGAAATSKRTRQPGRWFGRGFRPRRRQAEAGLGTGPVLTLLASTVVVGVLSTWVFGEPAVDVAVEADVVLVTAVAAWVCAMIGISELRDPVRYGGWDWRRRRNFLLPVPLPRSEKSLLGHPGVIRLGLKAAEGGKPGCRKELSVQRAVAGT